MARKKLTAAEKDRRKHERKAASLNAAEAKAHGPLFAHLAPTVTPDDAYWRWRFMKAGEESFVGPSAKAVQKFQLSCIKTEAARRIGAEAADKLALSFEKYPHSYRRGSWKDALTGRVRHCLRVELRFDPAKANEYNRDGRYVVEAEHWPPAGWTPVFTAAEFDAAFPEWDHDKDDYPEPDDGGLFERIILTLTRGHQ